MPPIKDLLAQIIKEGTQIEELNKAANDVMLGQIEVPTNVSVENTIREIETISGRLYQMHNANPMDAIILTKITTLLEMKLKVLGMTQIKPEMQDIIDSEINSYKKRFLTVASSFIEKTTMIEIGNKLADEGL